MSIPSHVLQAVDEELVSRTSEDPLYHVTYYGRLPSIAEEGLLPGSARSIGTSAYDAHAAGRTFLTESDGVDFWMNRAEAFAENRSDNPYADELVPVVLEVAPDCFFPADLKKDVPGTRDAGEDAWMTELELEPECLRVYTGKRWAPVEEYGEINPLSAFDVQPPDEDAGEDPLYYFKSSSPLKPEL